MTAGEQRLAETAKRAQHLEAQVQLGQEALEKKNAEVEQLQRTTAERQSQADDHHAEQTQRLKDEASRLQLSLEEAKEAQHAMMASNETLAAEVASRQLEVRELRREVSKLASVQDQLRTAEAKSQSLVDLLSEKEDVVRSAGESGSGAAAHATWSIPHATRSVQHGTVLHGRAGPALHRCASHLARWPWPEQAYTRSH